MSTNDVKNEKNPNNLMLILADELFAKDLFHQKITWSGTTLQKGGTRLMCRNFENIMKTYHAIIHKFHSDVKYNEVCNFFQHVLCKYAASRAKRKGQRTSTVYFFVEKKQKTIDYAETEGLEEEKDIPPSRSDNEENYSSGISDNDEPPDTSKTNPGWDSDDINNEDEDDDSIMARIKKFKHK